MQRLTQLALLRIGYKLTVNTRREKVLLAEEAALVALEGGRIVARGEVARAPLAAEATGDLSEATRDRFIAKAHEELPALLSGPLSAFAQERAEALSEDHDRLRAASGGSTRVSVEPVLPPDVIGLFTLLPAEDYAMASKALTDRAAWPSLTLRGTPINPATLKTIAATQDTGSTRARYRIRKGLTIREEIAIAFRVGQAPYDAFAQVENASAEATRRFI